MDGDEIGWRHLLWVIGGGGTLLLAFALAATQSAVVYVNRNRIKELAESKDDSGLAGKSARLLKLLERRNQLVDLLWCLSLLVLALAVTEEVLLVWGVPGLSLPWKAMLLGVLTLLYLVCFQLYPRAWASTGGDRVALMLVPFIEVVTFLFGWLGKLLQTLSTVFTRRPGGGLSREDEGLSDEEIRILLAKGKEEPEIEEEAKELIESIVVFGDTVVKEVMIPRIDMISVEVKGTIAKVLELAVVHGFSRFPVYEESVDNIVGVIYVKDLLPLLKEGTTGVAIREKMRPPKYVPESKKVHELLREMQKERVPMAIVLDEYGGTEGVVTMEDLLEEIVGEIADVHEKEAPELELLPDGTYLVDGRMNIEDLNEKLEIALPFEEFESIGGFVYGQMGRVPKEGEKAELDNVVLEVARIHRQRIAKVRVLKKTPAQTNNPGESGGR